MFDIGQVLLWIIVFNPLTSVTNLTVPYFLRITKHRKSHYDSVSYLLKAHSPNILSNSLFTVER